jgi:hypothetical protein
MIDREDARRLFRLALRDFAPRWEICADLTEITIRDPHHWLSGIRTFGATLRDPATTTLKVLGRRRGPEEGATFHRGISGPVLEAYLDGSPDPIRRYLQEIDVVDPAVPPRRLIPHVPSLISPPTRR